MGLLSKAENIGTAELNSPELNSAVSFSEFICNNEIKICALFEFIQDKYFITNSIGFDASSIISSVSTKDFWNGLCIENSVKEFSKKENSISTLLQFFSFNMSEKLESISALKNENRILVVCNKQIDDKIKKQFALIGRSFSEPDSSKLNSLINSKTKCINCTINFDEAIDSFITANIKDKTEIPVFKQSIFNELANRIICYTDINAVKVFDDGEEKKVKAIFLAKQNTQFQLLMTHLIINIREAIGDCAELTGISSEENCETFLQLKNFLQEE